VIGSSRTENTGGIATTLAATLVPDVNLDVYIYIKQLNGTTVPKSLIGLSIDIQIDSLAIWGVISNDIYSVGGILNFPNASEAGNLFSQLPQQSDIWTKLVGSSIYVVQGSGVPTESLKRAINNNKFKPYDDSNAMAQVAAMPYSCSIKPVAICIVKPNQAAIDILKQYVDTKTVNTVQNIYTWAKPKIIVIGLYSPDAIDIADLDREINNKTLSDADLCVVASANSAFPGFIVSPIVTRLLKNEGLTKIIFGDLTEYQASINIGNGQSIPALLNVAGNRVFATVSGNEPYAQTLMSNIKR
jgi:hypothetical protein